MFSTCLKSTNKTSLLLICRYLLSRLKKRNLVRKNGKESKIGIKNGMNARLIGFLFDARSGKKQGKSNKGKKNTETPQPTSTDALEPSAAPTTSSSKPQKSKRGSKAKQQQTGTPLTEKGDGSKSAKSPPRSKNAKKQASKKQQQQQLEQEPHQQDQPAKKPQQPLQHHVMPQFGRTNVPRKLVDTVVYDDFTDFIDMSGQGHSLGKPGDDGKTKHQPVQDSQQQAPVITSPFTAPETTNVPPPSQVILV